MNVRNPVSEGLFIPCLLFRSSPILGGKHNWTRGFHRPSKTIFLIFSLHVLLCYLQIKLLLNQANGDFLHNLSSVMCLLREMTVPR